MSNSFKDFFQFFERVLILCPHTDDEFGCAGAIRRMTQTNINVRYIALSRCEASVPKGLPIDILETECRNCTAHLGITPENVDIWNFPVRHFPEERQKILENFVIVNKEYKPDLVLIPSSSDTHQDHATVYSEGFRAFKYSSILGYELPQNIINFQSTAFIKLTKKVLQTKFEALSKYESQNFRNYANYEFISGLAKVRGVQCNGEFAEAFELIRLVI